MCQRILRMMLRGAMPLMRVKECEPAKHDCKPGINHMGSGAINVGRVPRRESMIVGRDGCSRASRNN
jgi:hypothetical protein